MANIDERPNRWPWPPIVYGLACIAAVLCARTIPLPFGDVLYGEFVRTAGMGLTFAGLGLDIWAILTLVRGQTAVLPNHAASALITHGPFALSRNPIYLGNTLLMVGLGFWWSNVWFVIFAFVAMMLVRRLAILREEAHLAARFGPAWKTYAARVRRWI